MILQIKAYKHTAGASKYKMYDSLICCAIQIILLFWLKFNESSVFLNVVAEGEINLVLYL